MTGTVLSAGLFGIDGYPVQVEADMSQGLPTFDMVGFLGSEVREARERVRTALKNTGIRLPACRLTVNLSPANRRKAGNGFDLPIAVAVLIAAGLLEGEKAKGYLFCGELGLDGALKPVHGTISVTAAAWKLGCRGCIVPSENRGEGAALKQIPVYGFSSLREVLAFLENPESAPEQKKGVLPEKQEVRIDFAYVIGQDTGVRAAEIAAAGLHNLILTGPPGTGKSMVAQRITTILPDLTPEEQIELTKLYSVRGFSVEGLMTERPFRSPHHTISVHAMAGGGSTPIPGEISLAHCGVLFLDELPEFRPEVLEVLRQPLEEGEVRISRTHGIYRFPARMMLVAARNPCRCGYYPDRNRCRCPEQDVLRYQRRISKPLLDRIDLSVQLPEVPFSVMQSGKRGRTSAQIRAHVLEAVERQRFRTQAEGGILNAHLTGKLLERDALPDTAGKKLLETLYAGRSGGMRSYHKLLRIARTIADLNGKEQPGEEEISEAWYFRNASAETERQVIRP